VLPLTVKENADGTWRVETARGRKVIANNLTREEAWKIWDQRDRELTRMENARRRVGYIRAGW
jgi:hypothetical protein